MKQLALNDVCELIVDCEHKTAPIQETGYPSIRTPNVGRGRLILDGVNRVSEETYRRWSQRAVPQTDDIILTREAPLGNAAIIPPNLEVCLGQRTVLIRPNKSKVDPHYLVYLLLGDKIQGQFRGLGAGATVPHLNMKDIRELPLPVLPPLSVQQQIGAILSAYDDLIENNTRRIQALEQAAHDLYREWFVEFRFPGHESVPLVDSGTEYGMIPQGWGVSIVGAILEHHIGGGWGKDEPDTKLLPAYVIRGTDIPDARYVKVDNCPLRFHAESNLKARRLQEGDIVFEVSGGSKGQPVGRALWIGDHLLRTFSEDVICASFCKLLRTNQAIASLIFYLYLLDIYQSGEIEKYQVQSTGIINFKFSHFLENALVLIPLYEVQGVFLEFVQPIFDEIQILGKRNNALRQARDLLLPRLVSGELDVSETDIDAILKADE